MTLNPEGRVGYAVTRQGKPVIGESRLGFLFTDAPQMLRNFALAGQSTRSFDETWEQPWGEYRTIRNRYNELTVSFDEKNWDKRRMTVVFRVYDDGIGFRYEIPKQDETGAREHRRRADRVRHRRTGRSLVGPGVRMEPRGICLQPNSDRAGRDGADAADRSHAKRAPLVIP